MQRISCGSLYEEKSGYSRAIVANGFVFVSATAAIGDDGNIVGQGDFYVQTRTILQKIALVLKSTGSSMNSVVQTRIYTVDVAKWEDIGKAHAEAFHTARPAMTLVSVRPFLDPLMLVEIELIAAIEKARQDWIGTHTPAIKPSLCREQRPVAVSPTDRGFGIV